MKHRTETLEGALLDAAVAHANGWKLWEGMRHMGLPVWLTGDPYDDGSPTFSCFCPSTDWGIGGKIIERERITILGYDANSNEWQAGFGPQSGDGPAIWMDHAVFGPTPLIAAMRAYVLSKLGAEVEL